MLRSLTKQRSGLDATEAEWLRYAERAQVWREMGYGSMIDYMGRVMGLGSRVAQDRLRVARAIELLPRVTAALANDELQFTAVRELVRVVTPSTEEAWCDAVRSKTVHEIEDMVAGRRPGDLPTDPPEPELRLCTIEVHVTPATRAKILQTRQVLAIERGMRLNDDQFMGAACDAVLGTSESRARYQIAVTTCEVCGQGWQQAAGRQIAVDRVAVERAECDAQRIGSRDELGTKPATQDVPPRVRRFVWRRDGGTCAAPGCRAARFLELHHIVKHPRSHEVANLCLLCDAHHVAVHNGLLVITGTAPDKLDFTWALEPPRAHVGVAVQSPNAWQTGP